MVKSSLASTRETSPQWDVFLPGHSWALGNGGGLLRWVWELMKMKQNKQTKLRRGQDSCQWLAGGDPTSPSPRWDSEAGLQCMAENGRVLRTGSYSFTDSCQGFIFRIFTFTSFSGSPRLRADWLCKTEATPKEKGWQMHASWAVRWLRRGGDIWDTGGARNSLIRTVPQWVHRTYPVRAPLPPSLSTRYCIGNTSHMVNTTGSMSQSEGNSNEYMYLIFLTFPFGGNFCHSRRHIICELSQMLHNQNCLIV